jgi:hypothetical protein
MLAKLLSPRKRLRSPIGAAVNAKPATHKHIMISTLNLSLGRKCLLAGAASSVLIAGVQADEVDFEGLQTGLVLYGVNSAGGAGPILVHGFNPDFPNENAAVVFDSSNPTGGDSDLGTPNADFGGPGQGSGGANGAPGQNDTALGKVLIVDEHLQTDNNGLVIDPDDAGGTAVTLEFDFSALGSVTLNSISYLDVEGIQIASAELFDANNASLGVFALLPVGNNGYGVTQTGGVSGVTRMHVDLGGSAAITGFDFDVDCNASIGDYVWFDVDQNGIQDGVDVGLEGVLVKLFDANSGPIGQTTTDANGFYEFNGLCAGHYVVEVDESTLPDGYSATLCLAGNDPGLDNDCSPAQVLLASGDARDDIDFGYKVDPFIFCESLPNSTGATARMDYTGSISITVNDFAFVISNLPFNKPAYLFYGTTQTSVPFGDGVRCIAPPLVRYAKIPSTGPNGVVTVPLDFTQPPLSSGPGMVLPGVPYYFQLWFRDPTGPAGFNTTSAMCITFAP